MGKIQAVVLDIGEVFHPAYSARKMLAERFGLDQATIKRIIDDELHKLSVGKMTIPAFWRSLREKYKIHQIDLCGRSVNPYPETLHLVEELKGRGFKVAVLSNTIPQHANRLISSGVLDDIAPEHRMFSFDLQARKPGALIYQRARKRLGVDHDQILFADDQINNLATARELGWSCVQFESPRITPAVIRAMVYDR